jgi:hypothetical protein
MDVIDEMGAALEESWRRHHFDERIFPELVTEALARFSPHRQVTPTDIVRWFVEHEPSTLPRQINLEATFGEPPITVFAGRHFYMEALYWLDGTTSIHQHGFSGAFQVLAGSSIHSTFAFEQRRRINSRMLIGDLRLTSTELLQVGAVRRIDAGAHFLHSLFHLDRPSVTLVVRTYTDPDAQPQYNYLPPHLGLDPFFKQEWLMRLLQAIAMLHKLDSPELVPTIERAVRRGDLWSTWSVLRSYLMLRPNATDELGRLLAIAREVHGQPVESFRPVLDELRRQQHIVTRRGEVRDPEHRFFLATLLNLPSQEHIFALIRQRFPGQEPAALIVRWLREIGDPLGFEFGDEELRVFQLLLDGGTPAEVVARLAADFDVGGAEDEIVALSEAFVTSLMFAPLFRTTALARAA